MIVQFDCGTRRLLEVVYKVSDYGNSIFAGKQTIEIKKARVWASRYSFWWGSAEGVAIRIG